MRGFVTLPTYGGIFSNFPVTRKLMHEKLARFYLGKEWFCCLGRNKCVAYWRW